MSSNGSGCTTGEHHSGANGLVAIALAVLTREPGSGSDCGGLRWSSRLVSFARPRTPIGRTEGKLGSEKLDYLQK